MRRNKNKIGNRIKYTFKITSVSWPLLRRTPLAVPRQLLQNWWQKQKRWHRSKANTVRYAVSSMPARLPFRAPSGQRHRVPLRCCLCAAKALARPKRAVSKKVVYVNPITPSKELSRSQFVVASYPLESSD
ncbi:hypothetical protein NPIL_241541 [Nephila pilipes]|uniref:Uncharacterized protein n=1 Tax=Nephila pilipes TaxID=299642 RepID=A0A8X6TM29_NEPPI|nr:hypothetical protein NPIL_241541 [Nephila pilipes]